VGHIGTTVPVDFGSAVDVDIGGDVDTDVITGGGVEIDTEVDVIRQPVFTKLLNTRTVVLTSVSVICSQTPQKAVQVVDEIVVSHELATHCAMFSLFVKQA